MDHVWVGRPPPLDWQHGDTGTGTGRPHIPTPANTRACVRWWYNIFIFKCNHLSLRTLLLNEQNISYNAYVYSCLFQMLESVINPKASPLRSQSQISLIHSMCLQNPDISLILRSSWLYPFLCILMKVWRKASCHSGRWSAKYWTVSCMIPPSPYIPYLHYSFILYHWMVSVMYHHIQTLCLDSHYMPPQKIRSKCPLLINTANN